ncbi:Rv3235 family protein [Streptosporangium sp. NPDC023615]|uniref:Rv3235 family protein n=1 Tax=Streptosporangium sp. NPDC023615 TaxID=3154794 RepID=UPI003418350E
MSPLRRPPALPRLARSPAAEPPYDDDRTGGDGSAAPPYVQGTLALVLGPEEREPPSPARRPGLSRRPAPKTPAPPAPPATRPPGPPPTRPSGAPGARPSGFPATRPPEPAATRPPGPADAGPPGSSGARPPDGTPDGRWLRALVQAVAEILAGRRPPATVSAHLTTRAQAQLAGSGRAMRCTRPPRAGRVHVSRPEDGVVEMCAVVDCGERSRVLALRLERRGVRWLCVAVETTP